MSYGTFGMYSYLILNFRYIEVLLCTILHKRGKSNLECVHNFVIRYLRHSANTIRFI